MVFRPLKNNIRQAVQKVSDARRKGNSRSTRIFHTREFEFFAATTQMVLFQQPAKGSTLPNKLIQHTIYAFGL
jgi:hypothetical protein